MNDSVVVLAGGTGAAKLARGMLDVVGPDSLTVLANTGDDIDIYEAYVSPDPDLITFWLGDLIDDRGWGLKGDSFHVMDGLRQLGVEVWFNLGDRDLAIGLERSRLLRSGLRLTEAHARIVSALAIRARVLPMSDNPVRTRVQAAGRWWPFQEFMIKGGAHGPIEQVEIRGARAAGATPEVLDALSNANAIVIGPSNPVISIGPILAIEEIRAAVAASPAPVVAVSPLVGGEVVKGPTEPFMEWARLPLTSAGIVSAYEGLIDGLVADEPSARVPTLETGVLMRDVADQRRLAEQTLQFARTLG